MNQVLSFSSGKGGVGKTSLVCNLGSLWARRGQKTLLVDGDWSLGKLGILFGITPKWTVNEVLSGKISMIEAVQQVAPNLHILASPNGVVGFEEIDEVTRNQIFFEMEGLADQFTRILFDHSSGVHWSVLQFAAAAHKQVVVTTPEPTSYTDAYAIMKILARRFKIREFHLVVTMFPGGEESQKNIERFCDVVRTQLGVRLRLLDILFWDARFSQAIRRRKPFVDIFQKTDATWQLEGICQKLEEAEASPNHGLDLFYGKQPNLQSIG